MPGIGEVAGEILWRGCIRVLVRWEHGYGLLHSKPGARAPLVDVSIPQVCRLGAGTADTLYYPRDLVHAVADGAALTGTSGGDRCAPLVNGSLRFVVASGGNGGVGSVVIYYED
jgi:hypothetical protein